MASISPPIKPEKARPPFSEERRATVRYLCDPATTSCVYLAEDVEFQRAWVQDLSTQGIGLLMNKPLKPGQLTTIHLKSLHSEKNYSLAAHAVHSSLEPAGNWIVGFQFVDPLAGAELADLL